MKIITRGVESLEACYRNLSVSIWQRSLSYSSIPSYHLHTSYPEYDLEDVGLYAISATREIKNGPHVICRLKDSLTQFVYRRKKYRLSAL